MKWVTWEQVAVDRMACAWLIRRFIDADAEFLFVPPGSQPLPAGAEPFDSVRLRSLVSRRVGDRRSGSSSFSSIPVTTSAFRP